MNVTQILVLSGDRFTLQLISASRSTSGPNAGESIDVENDAVEVSGNFFVNNFKLMMWWCMVVISTGGSTFVYQRMFGKERALVTIFAGSIHRRGKLNLEIAVIDREYPATKKEQTVLTQKQRCEAHRFLYPIAQIVADRPVGAYPPNSLICGEG